MLPPLRLLSYATVLCRVLARARIGTSTLPLSLPMALDLTSSGGQLSLIALSSVCNRILNVLFS